MFNAVHGPATGSCNSISGTIAVTNSCDNVRFFYRLSKLLIRCAIKLRNTLIDVLICHQLIHFYAIKSTILLNGKNSSIRDSLRLLISN